MRCIFLRFVLPLILFLSAQPGRAKIIFGTVQGRQDSALAGANIYFEKMAFGTSSDTRGRFKLQVSDSIKGKYLLICSYMGYHDAFKEITLPLAEDFYLRFHLKESRLLLDQIVVTGTRSERFLKDSPVTTQVIKSKEIRQSGSDDVAQVLQEMTGISVGQHERFGNVTDLQGFDSNHILFLVNGTRQIGRLSGQFDISQIPADNIERIEVVKGPASALYGSQAMGGVVNIITRRPEQRAELQASAKIGSYDRMNGSLTAGLPFGAWTTALHLDMQSFGGYDLDPATAKEDGRAYKKYNGGLEMNGQIQSGFRLGMEASYFREQQDRTLDLFFAEKIRNRRSGIKLHSSLDDVAGFALESAINYSTYRHDYFDVVRSSGYQKESDPSSNGLLSADILWRKKLSRHRLEGGYAYEKETIRSRRVEGKQRHSNLQSLFLQDEIELSAKTTIVAGARYDRHDIYGSEFSPKLSLVYSPIHTGRIRLGYGHGFRAPAFKELFLDFYVSDVNLKIIGNPNLKPEVSDGLHLDYEFWNDHNYHVRLNLFYNRVRDMISDVLLPGAGLTYTYHNFNRIQSWGGEWDMAYFPLDWLQLKLGYSYTDTKVESSGRALSGRIKHKGQAGLMLSLPWDIKMNIRSLLFGPRTDSEIDEDSGEITDHIKIPGYVLVNAHIEYRMPFNLRLQAGGKNLTNYVKKFWGPMPGREWYFGLIYTLH